MSYTMMPTMYDNNNMYQQQAPAMYAKPLQPVAAANPDRHVMAERYKTKACRNYVANGFCPYETRCMFAHGDHELRTPEMNLRDGLITEEAIKTYQRVLNLRQRESSSGHRSPPAYVEESSPARALYTHNPYVNVLPRRMSCSSCPSLGGDSSGSSSPMKDLEPAVLLP
jgi:hypothetical protein